jgi:hypothetical protein
MARVSNTSDAYRNIPWRHFRCGDHVHREDDERHVGVIRAIFDTVVARIEWLDTNMMICPDTGKPYKLLSDEPTPELVKVPKPW